VGRVHCSRKSPSTLVALNRRKLHWHGELLHQRHERKIRWRVHAGPSRLRCVSNYLGAHPPKDGQTERDSSLKANIEGIENHGLPIDWTLRRREIASCWSLVYVPLRLADRRLCSSLGAPCWFDTLNKSIVTQSTVKLTKKSGRTIQGLNQNRNGESWMGSAAEIPLTHRQVVLISRAKPKWQRVPCAFAVFDLSASLSQFLDATGGRSKALLLDGLDEVRGNLFPPVLQKIKGISDAQPEISVFLSSRSIACAFAPTDARRKEGSPTRLKLTAWPVYAASLRFHLEETDRWAARGGELRRSGCLSIANWWQVARGPAQ